MTTLTTKLSRQFRWRPHEKTAKKLYFTTLFLISLLPSYLCCPMECVCYDYGKRVDCSNRKLTKVPPNLPDSVLHLDLSYNSLSEITETDFSSIDNLNSIDLKGNEIVIVENGAFSSQKLLETLDLSNNYIQTLTNFVFPDSLLVEYLDLSNNKLTYIDQSLFTGFRYLEELSLENNSISCIEESSFENLYSVRSLNLKGNKLTNMYESNISPLGDLQELSLDGNRFLCKCNLAWFPNWRADNPDIVLDDVLCHTHHTGQSIASLPLSDLSCSDVIDSTKLCPKEDICPKECECTDGIVQCQERGLQEIPRNLPHSAKEIKLMKNMIRHIPGGIFKHIKGITRIDLSSNSISTIDAKAFEGLTEINQICLYSNSIQELPENLFEGLTKLQILLLNSNRISCLPRNIFRDVDAFSLLSLYKNNLQSFSNGTVRIKPTGHIHLGENPLICDCNLRWIKAEKSAGDKSMTEFDTSDAMCDWPLRLKDRKIKELKEVDFTCEGGESARTKNAGRCFVDLKCPIKCNCSEGTKVDCSNGGFRSIPMDVPRYTTELILNNNLIDEIPADGKFLNMVNLRSISLTGNLIEKIEDGAFFGASELVHIELSNNNLQEIRRGMFKDLPNLQRVLIRNNRITCLKNDTFLDNKNLELLSFFNNEIRTIEENPFDKLQLLQTLNLYSNPLICNCHMSWLNKWIKAKPSGMVTGNPTCVEPRHLRNLPIFDLTPLDFECTSNKENSCVSSLKCPEQCTCVKTAVRCHDKHLTDIPKDIPRQVTELILSKNSIRKINLQILKGLKELKVLDLSENMISTIPDNTFQTLIKLESLNLVDNYIKCIGHKAFHGLVSLKYLSLTTNMISQIPENSFKDLTSLTHLYLSNNPLYCDCDTKWLARLIQNKELDGGVAKCEQPSRMAGQALLFTDASNYRCEPGEPPLEVQAKCNPCLFEPCRNGGTCGIDEEIEFKCHCPREFGGRYCENVLSKCYIEPCKNGGQCHPDKQSSYWCECPIGYSGKHCELNIDDCAFNKCLNNATCIDGVNEFVCQCAPGFEGEFCETDIDLCDYEHNKCRNGAPCEDLVHDYTCKCQPGFKGKDCEVNINECLDHACQNGAKCVDEIDGYTCACVNGYKGKFCEIAPLIYPQNSQCEKHDCKNEAMCYEDPESVGYKCKCAPGYTGDRCERLSSLSFEQYDSYVLTRDFLISPVTNISMVFTPNELTGILLYHNPDHRQKHLLVQLHEGKVRVSYYLTTTEGLVIDTENMTINMNIENKLHIYVNNLMIIVYLNGEVAAQGNVTKTMTTSETGISDSQSTYIGGLPPTLRDSAAKMWHIVPDTANSFSGCISTVVVNKQEVNFANYETKSLVEAGCQRDDDYQMDSSESPCSYHLCQNGAECEPMGHVNYRCNCPQDYGGPMCSEKLECNVERQNRFMIDDCESSKIIRHTVCPKTCGRGKCCKSVLDKEIKSRFECKNGTKTEQLKVKVVRKCECGEC